MKYLGENEKLPKITKVFLNQPYEGHINTNDRIEPFTFVSDNITTFSRKVVELTKEFFKEHEKDSLIVYMDSESIIVKKTKIVG